jgi:predicted hydrocarbon binding protein
MVRDFQDRITTGTWQGVCSIDAGARDKVLECQAASCVRAFAELYAIPHDLELADFLEKMRMGGSSRVVIERDGDDILWSEQHEGRCVCPLVTRNVIPLGTELCGCAAHWVRMLFERHARTRVAVELVESTAQGAENCVFRVKVLGAIDPGAEA